jgi:hypothetical protein
LTVTTPPRPDQQVTPQTTAIGPGSSAGILRAREVIIIGAGGLILVYSPSAGAGNLVYSVAAQAGSDPYGNAYLAGGTSYGEITGVWYAASVQDEFVGFYHASSEGGPWMQDATLVSAQALLTSQPGLICNGPLFIATPSTPPSPSTGTPGLFTPNGTGKLAFVDGFDGNTYDLGTYHAYTTSPQTVSSTTPVAVTGLSIPVEANLIYRITGSVTYQCNQSAGVPTIGFSGPAVSGVNNNFQYTVRENNGSGTQPLTYFNNSTLGSDAGPTMVNNDFVEFTFTANVEFSANGTFEVTAATSAGADTFTIQSMCWFDADPVNY